MSRSSTREMIDSLERQGQLSYKVLAPYRVNVPLGKARPWTIDQFETQYDIAYMRHARDGRAPGLGKFTRLAHEKRGTVMSDTAAEIQDLRPYLYDLKGDVLITGLGLGMVVHALVTRPENSDLISSITVIEADADILKLTGDHYRKADPRITIIHHDAFTWQPPKGQKFDAAWHDVWDTISEDNDFTGMRRNYQRHMRKKNNQHCWGEVYAKRGNQRGWG